MKQIKRVVNMLGKIDSVDDRIIEKKNVEMVDVY